MKSPNTKKYGLMSGLSLDEKSEIEAGKFALNRCSSIFDIDDDIIILQDFVSKRHNQLVIMPIDLIPKVE